MSLASTSPLNAFAFGELLFFDSAQRKVTKRKGASRSELTRQAGVVAIFRRDILSLRKTPHVLCGALRVYVWRSGRASLEARPKTDATLSLALVLAGHAIPAIDCLRKTPKGRRPWMGAVFSRAMDGESENRSRIPTGDLALSGKAAFFWLLFFAALQRKVTRQRRKRVGSTPTHPKRPSARRRAEHQRKQVSRRRGYFCLRALKEK